MLRDALRAACAVLAVILFGVWLGLALTGWLSGCGEHWTDSRGVVHVEQCRSIYAWR
jgi:hypothetical protein